ncbi:MAG: tRNA (adenosine(37)-N6)-threonylcarbamoyltransferase complex ATPase subunit type 1 TsaE [Arcobacter sp.]|nr:tRNA (adenosine(37)-N6)-threonylcarbamoyltransferase complex ATPase subunit type 1 TsaE [Arcobacter sp.]
MKKEFTLDLKNINVIVDELKNIINDDIIVILRGDLASGKTTLVKNYVKALGLDDLVTSPTFSLQSVYSNDIYHYDIYNKTLEEFIALGMLEEFEKSGVHFVEWGDEKLQNLLIDYGYNVILVEIEKSDNKRLYKINA